MAQRFPKLTQDEMTPSQRAVAAEITAGPRGEVRGPFIAWIHHPELARRLQALGEQLRWKATLPPQLIELAVLICARRWNCQHEWFMHEKLARQAGLDSEILGPLSEGERPGKLLPEQAAVYDFCKDLHGS
ncbi:MAG TPA: carboxymuconolactone decarboxylase family protein, partial [Burkholderiales bacterium]|nr:carboxymuconolactone decarboxylase family protein [Burkholderiales bacterium]